MTLVRLLLLCVVTLVPSSQVIEVMLKSEMTEGNTRTIVLTEDWSADAMHSFLHACHGHCVEIDHEDTNHVAEFLRLLHLYQV